MTHRNLKLGYFVLEGLNSFATTYYFYYFYFFMQQAFGFGNRANLCLAALNGAVYAVMSLSAGKFAERFGYFKALKVGFGVMMVALFTASFLHSAVAHAALMIVAVTGMCFTWPTLEALVSENETPAGIQRMVGIYNVVWAGTGALAYFTGGAMLEKFGLSSLFYVPVAIQFGQLCLTFWLERGARQHAETPVAPGAASARVEMEFAVQPAAVARTFLRMAWLTNPFAYIAINTLVAVMPGVAGGLGLSTMAAGFCCSIWCFARLGAFFLLWFWNGWHFRFGWLLSAYLGLVSSFAVIMIVPRLWSLLLAQVVLGGALGLIYYSSLYYSMHGSESKGEHGGIHEAAIGLGNFAGPALGAASLWAFPHVTNIGALAVSGLLLSGLGGLVVLWQRRTHP
jgi:predicted MFS family arabinose efflux permease